MVNHHTLLQTEEETLNDKSKEVSMCFLLYGDLHNYESIRTAAADGRETGLLNRRILSTADFDFNNFKASLTGSLAFVQ